MRRLSLFLLAALTGCGAAGAPGGAEPPTAGALFADSLQALASQQDTSARFRLSGEARPEGGPAALLAGDLVSLELEGAASATALVAKGKLEAAGQTFEGEIRAGDGTYVRVGDDWYGSPDTGSGEGDLRIEPPPGVSMDELLGALRGAGDGLVDGDVAPGPEIGGDETWQVEGTVNPDHAVEIARRLGTPLSAADEAALRDGAGDLRIEYAAGRDDHLPRRIAVEGALTTGGLLGGVGAELPLDGVRLDLELELSDWGTPVEVEPPERYTSFEHLLGSLFGLSLESVPHGAIEPGAAPQLPQPPGPSAPPPELSVPPPEIPEPSIPVPTPPPSAVPAPQ